MDKSLLFWLVYVISVIVTVFLGWPLNRTSGQWLVILLLLGILGWGVFGPVVR
jgi:hypothetical protein